MRRAAVVGLLLALLALPASVTAQGESSWAPPQDRDAWRWFFGGGIAIPAGLPGTSYNIGGGATFGLEFPQSDVHSFLACIDYDHMNEYGYGGAPGDARGTANIASLRAGLKIQRRRNGIVREYTQAGFGLTFEALSATQTNYVSPGAVSTSTVSRHDVGPLFTVGGGIEVRPESGPGVFLDSQLQFLFAGGQTALLFPVRLGFVFTPEP